MTIKRSPLKRGPGAKAKREAPALRSANEAVRARSRGYCEANAQDDGVHGFPCSGWGAHAAAPGAHHIWPEDRDRGLHDPERMLALCFATHRWAHDEPKLSSAARLLRPES
jgi:hypothetical protein